MIDLREYGMIHHFGEKGYTISAIGRELGIDRNTVKEVSARCRNSFLWAEEPGRA